MKNVDVIVATSSYTQYNFPEKAKEMEFGEYFLIKAPRDKSQREKIKTKAVMAGNNYVRHHPEFQDVKFIADGSLDGIRVYKVQRGPDE